MQQKYLEPHITENPDQPLLSTKDATICGINHINRYINELN